MGWTRRQTRLVLGSSLLLIVIVVVFLYLYYRPDIEITFVRGRP
jgi:hypothetical protein